MKSSMFDSLHFLERLRCYSCPASREERLKTALGSSGDLHMSRTKHIIEGLKAPFWTRPLLLCYLFVVGDRFNWIKFNVWLKQALGSAHVKYGVCLGLTFKVQTFEKNLGFSAVIKMQYFLKRRKNQHLQYLSLPFKTNSGFINKGTKPGSNGLCMCRTYYELIRNGTFVFGQFSCIIWLYFNK